MTPGVGMPHLSSFEVTVLLIHLVIVVAIFVRVRFVLRRRADAQAAPESAVPPGLPEPRKLAAAEDEGQCTQRPTHFTAVEIAEARSLFDHFMQGRAGFDVLLNEENLRFSRRALCPKSSIFLTEGRLHCTAEDFLRLWTDFPLRRRWDVGLADIEELDDGAVYHAIRYPYPLSQRFYIYDRQVIRDADGGIFFLCKSAAARKAKVAASKPGVFCAQFLSYAAIRPAPHGSCDFVMYNHDVQALALPSWIIDRLLKYTYPGYMAKVREAVETSFATTSDAGAPPGRGA